MTSEVAGDSRSPPSQKPKVLPWMHCSVLDHACLHFRLFWVNVNKRRRALNACLDFFYFWVLNVGTTQHAKFKINTPILALLKINSLSWNGRKRAIIGLTSLDFFPFLCSLSAFCSVIFFISSMSHLMQFRLPFGFFFFGLSLDFR